MASTPAWRHLLSVSMGSNGHLNHSSYFQLATVKPDGRPANRTVVFRGFVEDTNKLQFTTDSRSHKIEEIRQCPYGEVCWYFTDSWEQFRIQGKLDIIGETETDPGRVLLRQKAWFASSLKSRLQFFGPHPGFPILNTEADLKQQLDSSVAPVGTFCLVTLDPEQIDYLNVKSNHRLMFKFLEQKLDGTFKWIQEEVNP